MTNSNRHSQFGRFHPHRRPTKLALSPNMSFGEINNLLRNLTPLRKKGLHRLRENIPAFINHFGIDHVGLLTLSFRQHVTWKEASRRLNSLLTTLRPEMRAFIRVAAVSSGGRVHFHILVALRDDIRSGFNATAFEQWSKLNRRRYARAGLTVPEKAEIRSLWDQITPNTALASCNRRWRTLLPRYGFGYGQPMVLLPILETPEQLAGYLVKNVRDSFHDRAYPPGAQPIRYSRGCPQRIGSNKFAWNGPGSRDYRRKVSAFVERVGCSTSDEMHELFGDQWQYQFRKAIEDPNRLSSKQLSALRMRVSQRRTSGVETHLMTPPYGRAGEEREDAPSPPVHATMRTSENRADITSSISPETSSPR